MIHTQFLKRTLGCNINTSNIMTRGEMGVRPLLMDVNLKVMTYIKNIQERRQAIAYSAMDLKEIMM